MIALLVCGCAIVLPADDLPTLIPAEELPTVIALTAQANMTQNPPTPTDTPEPTETASPEPTPTNTSVFIPAQPTRTQSPDETPNVEQTPDTHMFDGEQIPFAEIQFIRPGALSRVVSPIDLHVYLRPGANGRVRVEMYGEDNRLMYRKLFVFPNTTTMVNLFTEIDFEVPGVAEAARLVVSMDDAAGRTLSLASEEVILLSIGEEDINPAGDLLETIVIREPEERQLVQGGEVRVSGLARIGNDLPLLIELVGTDGRVIGQRLAGIASGSQDRHRVYVADVPYEAAVPTWVRLTVRELHPVFGTPVNVSTIEILLGD